MRRAHDIPAAMINLRIGVAQELGADKGVILREAGLTEGQLANPTNRVSVEATMKVWSAILQQTGSHDVGLIAGSRVSWASLGMLGYLAMNSLSLGKAFEKLCVYQRLVVSIAFFDILAKGAKVSLELEMKDKWAPDFRYTIDYMVASIASLFSKSTHKEIKPIEVGFPFPALDNTVTYQKIFAPATIHFDCPKAYITYQGHELNNPIIGANPEMFKHFEKELTIILEEHDRKNRYTREVKQLILENLKAEIPTIEKIAKSIGVGTRSLQAFLKEEGTSYRTLLNEVRKEVSIYQLKNKRFNVSEVAFLTGFSDIAVFSRSFKKWTGVSPSQFQLQYRS